jgi:hypothetical protein
MDGVIIFTGIFVYLSVLDPAGLHLSVSNFRSGSRAAYLDQVRLGPLLEVKLKQMARNPTFRFWLPLLEVLLPWLGWPRYACL